MKDRRKASDRKREVIEGADPALRELPRRRAALLFAAGVALGAVVAYVVVHFAPADKPRPAKSELTSEPPVTPQRTAPRQPTVILASLALPATAEQLQQETRQVATALRTRYPDRAEALHVAAMMHVQLRQSGEGEKLWKECIKLSPKKEQYYVNLAAVAMDRGNSELAAETLQRALDVGLSSADVLHHLGVALTNLGRNDEAVQVLKRALVDNPQLASHWMVLGQAQLKLGQPEEAEASLKQAIGMGLQSSAAYAALASACAQQKKQDEAAKYREILTRLTASRPMAAQERFRILSTDEARRTAVAILTEAATVHSWQGNSLEAERLLLRAIALDPASAASCRALATIYRDANMTAEEQVVWRRLIELEPYNFDNYLNSGKFLPTT